MRKMLFNNKQIKKFTLNEKFTLSEKYTLDERFFLLEDDEINDQKSSKLKEQAIADIKELKEAINELEKTSKGYNDYLGKYRNELKIKFTELSIKTTASVRNNAQEINEKDIVKKTEEIETILSKLEINLNDERNIINVPFKYMQRLKGLTSKTRNDAAADYINKNFRKNKISNIDVSNLLKKVSETPTCQLSTLNIFYNIFQDYITGYINAIGTTITNEIHKIINTNITILNQIVREFDKANKTNFIEVDAECKQRIEQIKKATMLIKSMENGVTRKNLEIIRKFQQSTAHSRNSYTAEKTSNTFIDEFENILNDKSLSDKDRQNLINKKWDQILKNIFGVNAPHIKKIGGTTLEKQCLERGFFASTNIFVKFLNAIITKKPNVFKKLVAKPAIYNEISAAEKNEYIQDDEFNNLKSIIYCEGLYDLPTFIVKQVFEMYSNAEKNITSDDKYKIINNIFFKDDNHDILRSIAGISHQLRKLGIRTEEKDSASKKTAIEELFGQRAGQKEITELMLFALQIAIKDYYNMLSKDEMRTLDTIGKKWKVNDFELTENAEDWWKEQWANIRGRIDKDSFLKSILKISQRETPPTNPSKNNHIVAKPKEKDSNVLQTDK